MKQLHSYIFAILCLLGLDSAFALDFPYSEWSLANYEGAYATFNEGFVSVADGGSDYWHVQLTRNNIELQAGKTYEVKFNLQGVSARRYVEVRIGRDGFPYDAFAEFGEIAATVNGRTVTKTFTMQSGNVSNARFEFNLGKNSGTVYLFDVSLNCLDCGSNQNIGGNNSYTTLASDWGYVVVADMVDFRDNSMSLGDVFGKNLELGVDSKIYGNVDASNHCFLRERANISGDLRYTSQCEKQNGVVVKTKSEAALSKPVVGIPNIIAGITPISVGLDQNATLSPNNYGAFYANARSKVHLSSGSYTFQNIFTEPDAEFAFDLTSGPITINVLGNVRFGDRNTFSITGGNPSEILWNVAGENVDMGTDGLYFGKFVAPSAFVRIPSRSHLVGAVYANKFQIEPQSTVSQEPRATEISHSEEHFGPFFEPGVFRYVSQQPLSASAIEMFVYADNAQFKVNGETSTTVELPSSNVTANISLTKNMISGFPTEAFSSNYVFNFTKSANYRIYWNPQTQCKQGCDGTTVATAVGDFATVLETAKATGREINMAGGVWNVTDNFTDGIVPWKVGFELKGNTENLWDLTSETDLPLINLGNVAHIEIEGRSPRSFTGLRIANGFNAGNGGAIGTANQKINLKNVLISSSNAGGNGGAIYSSDTMNLENCYFGINLAYKSGGALYAKNAYVKNGVFEKNESKEHGGAIYVSAEMLAQNVIFSQNKSVGNGGAILVDGNIQMTNATVFGNLASEYSAITSRSGIVYNSIIWGNKNNSCSEQSCLSVLSTSLSVHHSVTQVSFPGVSNTTENPLFIDESNPAGVNRFFSFDAGLTLQKGSPAIAVGYKDGFVLNKDILNTERNESVDLGAYSWYEIDEDFEYGVFFNEQFKKTAISRFVFEALPNWDFINFVAHGKYGRVIKKLIKKHKKTKIDKGVVQFTLLDENFNPYANVPSVNVTFFRNGEENGKYVFQSIIKNPTSVDYDPEKHGRLIIFSSDLDKIGIHHDVIVIPVLKPTDQFEYKVIEW